MDLAECAELKLGSSIVVTEVDTERPIPPGKVRVVSEPSVSRAPALELGNENSPLLIEQTRHGVFILNRHDMSIDQEMLRYGEYAESEVKLMIDLTAKDATLLDIGANIGALTLPLARHLSSGTVFAFEPQRYVYYRLCGNMALNGITNVICVNAAVGAETGTVMMPRIDYSRYHFSAGVRVRQTGDGDEVPLVQLEKYHLGAGKVGFIKIDVEGFEASVIAGGIGLIERDRPAIYFECRSREKFRDIHKRLSRLGYRFYWHPAPLFDSANFAANAVDHFHGAGVNSNILALAGGGEPGKNHGLVMMQDEFEFWPAHRFAASWRDKISEWSRTP